MEIGAYNALVVRHFRDPAHAGDLERSYGLVLTGDAEEPDGSARISLTAGVSDGKLAELRYRVLGCPHLIAALEESCSRLVGKPVDRLAGVSTGELLERLSVPAGKTGRILMIEDVCRVLHRQAIRQ